MDRRLKVRNDGVSQLGQISRRPQAGAEIAFWLIRGS